MKLELGLWAGARHGDEDQGEDLDGDEGGLLIKLKCEALASPPYYVEYNRSQQETAKQTKSSSSAEF